MLKASAHAQQWEYFEYVYKEMILQGYQLDQSKHAWLLVEPARAGKGHLLENVFEAILEAGEIPLSLLFTEMVCVALELGDYERSKTIVNTMAYAPFQVSVKQWNDLYGKNKDRISMECLRNFLEVLRSNEMAKEASMSNLLGSLQSICMSSSAKELPVNTALSSVLISNSPNLASKNLSFIAEMQQDYGNLAYDSRYSDTCSSHTFRMDKVPPNEFDDFSDDEEQILEMVGLLDIPVSEVDDFQGPDLPSADEILKVWKENREKDGFISCFDIR